MTPTNGARRGDWVRVRMHVLDPAERSPALAAATRAHPLQCWVNGFLQDESASVGDEVEITSLTRRVLRGVLSDPQPRYEHGFGTPQTVLLPIAEELRAILREGEN